MKYRLYSVVVHVVLAARFVGLRRAIELAVATMILLVVSRSFSATYAADVVVVSGSLGAPAAALSAARLSTATRVLVIEPTDWLGGQATAQGVAAIDNAWHEPAASLMRTQPALYYPADYRDWLGRMTAKPPAAPGTGMGPSGTSWVSREAFDPRTGAWILDQMIAETSSITVLKMTVVKQVTTASLADDFGIARRITSLTLVQRSPRAGYTPFTKYLSAELPDWYGTSDSADFSKQVHTVVPTDAGRGLVVVDASETADAVVLSGAAYTVGRELTTEALGEDGSLPAMNESGSQATVYPFCMTDAAVPDPEAGLKSPWPDFDSYYNDQTTGYFSISGYSWPQVWTYRRLKANGGLGVYTVANQGDVSMQNWYPGNDFPYGSIYLDKAACAAQAGDWRGGMDTANLAGAEKHAIAWYFWMKNSRSVTWDTHYLVGSDLMNMMATPTGLARFPYIRCGRRIIGLDNFRLTERYFVSTTTNYTGGSSYRFHDSVGIGNYACDVHPQKNTTGMSPSVSKPAPFYIPYRALGSTNVRNLLVGGKLLATTFCSNSAYRLHPIEWAIGSAAGTAAAIMSRDGRTNLDLLDTAPLRALQTAVNQNSPISWAAYDSQPIPPQNGDLVLNDFNSVAVGDAFRAEIYHHRAVKARLYREGTFVGETTTKTNGRLVLDGLTVVATGRTTFTAQCLDGSNDLLDTLTATITAVAGLPKAGQIVDDADATNFTLWTTSGTWVTGTAQPNKWATSYRYTSGSGNASNPTRGATWALPIHHEGVYEVFIWYPESSNRITDAPFTVYYSGGAMSQTTRVNQQLNGGVWLSLGQYFFAGGNAQERVVLTNATNDAVSTHYVIADAAGVATVMLTPVRMSRFDIE